MTSILIVEDDPLISAFVQKGLRRNGYLTQLADDGATARLLGMSGAFDLVVLGLGPPDRDGLRVLREIRSAGHTVPVVVLTGLPERDATTCLESGADDYMRKPFHFAELLARVRRRLRAAGSLPSGATLSAGAVQLDLRARRAWAGGRVVDLTSREFGLLEAFLRRPDQVLSREQLLEQVWGYCVDPGTNVVNVYVNALRKKLGHGVIHTVRGVGYRLGAA
ncbi:response regulator transcription factor [Jiangella asiatica]|uniref:Response regulator transcription factor n=1 Tax=Jiangella asiatica TaxID=2530372 RepID=A0A4R5DUE6_9ACTN|nr:response regulator transcription factor [Jiangella asiatica]TDE15940.1 response regulator transcription factor [Jiangella asiatica]